MALSKKMEEAIELLKKEEFYLCDNGCSVWKAYNLSQTIHTRTMEALERRGVVKIEPALTNHADKTATLLYPDYEELSASEYCLRCADSYESSCGRYLCRKTGQIVVGTDGKATINAMKCGG